MSSKPPHEPTAPGLPGSSTDPSTPIQAMEAPADPAATVWPDALPKESSGWGSFGRMVGAVMLFCLPIGGLSLIGINVGPLTKDVAANQQVTLDGSTHSIAFTLPWACVQDLSDPSTNSFSCNQDDREVEITIRSADNINDIERSARRALREAIRDRVALEFPSQVSDIQTGKVAHVTAGTGRFGVAADSLVASPSDDESGFTINIKGPVVDDGDESATAMVTEHLLDTISFKKNEDGEQ